MIDRFPIPSYKIKSVVEYPNSDRVEFILKNGFRIIASKKQFQDYKAFKNSVEMHNKKRT